ERSENQALLNWQKKALKDATDRQTATAKITGASCCSPRPPHTVRQTRCPTCVLPSDSPHVLTTSF
ncbi:MAG: hypothetical protein IKZ69_04750, partial [Lachnospiraceae bacterium]|nr:hypothetical protein [Lachnospiraceae bacterium]